MLSSSTSTRVNRPNLIYGTSNATPENPKFITAILKSRKRFEALRSFTLESGQAEIERIKQSHKEAADRSAELRSPTESARGSSVDGGRSPASLRTPSLSNVPEENSAFAVGDDEDSDDEHESALPTSVSSTSNHHSRTPSIASSTEGAVPTQLGGMSEKARGKMRIGTPTFSRVNSMNSVTSHTAISTTGAFAPSPQWVSWPELVQLQWRDWLTTADRFVAALSSPSYHTNTYFLDRGQ